MRNIPPKDLESEVVKMIRLDITPDRFVIADTQEPLPPGSPVFGMILPISMYSLNIERHGALVAIAYGSPMKDSEILLISLNWHYYTYSKTMKRHIYGPDNEAPQKPIKFRYC